ACSKALGTGFRNGVFWRDMEVVPEPSGKPTLLLHGGALERLLTLIPEGMDPQVDVSLTDEAGLAHAMVIISANPAKR
ncbi:MAG: holo-ACP synthase, partial [Alphaproteobacteria bacterium]|nr:holo-ACP synthase [Alphaproteobacteria bacterium]